MSQKIVFLAQFQVIFKKKKKNHHMPDALCFIESLVKISNKFDHISVGYIQKNRPETT